VTIRDDVMAVLKGEVPERIPWLIYANLLPRGFIERKLREMGLGLAIGCSVYRIIRHNVTIEERIEGDYLYRIYRTPIGSSYEKYRVGLKRGTGDSWRVEYLIKSDKDYDIVEFIIEDMEYEPYYDEFLMIERDLGEDGVVFAWGDYTPLMKIIIELMGFRKFAIEIYRNPERIKELMKLIDEKERELYGIIAESPAEIVKVGDNIDSMLVSPEHFKEYCVPYYNAYAGILHGKGKIVMSHMDGRLRVLKDLIAQTKLDVIEAFTPPPMGDLTITEAKMAWKGKIIWINFPESTFVYEDKRLMEFTKELLREIAPGDGFILGITEDPPPEHFWRAMMVITRTLYRYGRYPIRL